ncbi:MAG: TRAP transporter small permease subunit [Methyloligellaceae bacterium]
MQALSEIIATWLQLLLPTWVRMPSLTFVLPHTAYWLGLIIFPLLAMFIVHKNREKVERHSVSVPLAYMLWFWGGFVGLHRFYVMALKSGAVYVLLFLLILYGNVQSTKSRNALSGVNNNLRIAEFTVKKLQKNVDRGREADIPKLQKAQNKVAIVQKSVDAANLQHDKWRAFAGAFLGLISIFLLIDALLIPMLVNRCRKNEPSIDATNDFQVMERGSRKDERSEITNPAIRTIEWLNGKVGVFVAYWSLLAVFVYYYEVVARYVFNSPTNWAHESMFLMFGMQYLLSSAYALREDSHVRVDVIYELFSLRTKAIMDVITSFFFFIFTVTLLLTGFLFAWDSFDVLEISFTEWGIQYWPVKMTIVIGAFLLLLQGIAKLIRDITYLKNSRGA